MNNETLTTIVLCPGFHKTGGTELAHQLVYELSQRNYPASIAYYGPRKTINPAYEKYVSSFIDVDKIGDSKDLLIVVPETKIEYLKYFSKARTAIWWMSVDNYLLRFHIRDKLREAGPAKTLYTLLSSWNYDFPVLVNSADYHFCQSYYALDYLKQNHISSNLFMLSDYINSEYLAETPILKASSRKRCILYNPQKGMRFTKQLMKMMPENDWVALRGLSNNEIKKLLRTSRLYVDFGNHPGKDRLPREAAACGCCIITGRRGSACNDFDIPIPRKYKFREDPGMIIDICNQITKCLDAYDEVIGDFQTYRNSISEERRIFQQQISEIFLNISENAE